MNTLREGLNKLTRARKDKEIEITNAMIVGFAYGSIFMAALLFTLYVGFEIS